MGYQNRIEVELEVDDIRPNVRTVHKGLFLYLMPLKDFDSASRSSRTSFVD